MTTDTVIKDKVIQEEMDPLPDLFLEKSVDPRFDESFYPDPFSDEFYPWLDDVLERTGSKIPGMFPHAAKTIGHGIELRLHGTLKEMVDDFLSNLSGTESKPDVIKMLSQLIERWVQVNYEPSKKAFEGLFNVGFNAGVASTGGKIGSFDEQALKTIQNGTYRIGNRIVLFGDDVVKKFADIIKDAYTPEGTFSLVDLTEKMDKVVDAERYQLQRIARTETNQVTGTGRLAKWAQDDDKHFYGYNWNSTPDSRRREMKALRSSGNPYTFDEISFLFTHNKQFVPDIGWQMGAINCRCSISRAPRDEEFTGNRFAGSEGMFEKTSDFDLNLIGV